MQVEGRKIDFSEKLADLFTTFKDANGRENPIPQYKGEVGIEVEVEGRNLPKAPQSYWVHHPDHSLRGAENAEYVLKQPCRRTSVTKFLIYLDKFLKAKGAKIDESNRTSVHVHVNMADKSLVQCYNYIILYLIFEDLLTNIAGESRRGNLFCLRARDAEFFVDVLAGYAKARKFNPDPEKLRYTSINVCAMTKFNSLEFRALRGTTDPKIITDWVELLLAIKDASLLYQFPDQILGDFSVLGPDDFVRKVFPEHVPLFLQQANYHNMMWEGARLVQEIVYATDWTKNVKPKRMFEVAQAAPNDEDD